MMIISICDDDRRQLDALKTVLREWDRDVQIHGYNSAEQFLFSYPEESCDLLLLDIEMGDMNGIELARKLRNRGDMLPIIFITGYSEFMQQGFDVEALHYLLKPLDRNKLFEVRDRYAKRHTNDARIVIRSGDELVCISTSDIVCLEAFGKKTQIRLSDGRTILSDCGLGAVSEKLGETF
ncbi:MAG: response regulator transcription factor, partial [Oscillospiraceae bacterium]|nr:response regulator transcription factor [Oscillospiraceae bacterium]